MNNTKDHPRPGIILIIAALAAIAAGAFIRLKLMQVPFFFTHDDDWAVFGKQVFDMLDAHYFRAFMYRQSYMGVLPLAADMAAFFLLGTTRTAQAAASMFYWAAYLACVWALAKTIFSCGRAAAFSLICAALMPAASFFLCPQPARGYLDNFCLGMAVFIITVKIVSSERERPGLWLLLGLLGGISFWTSFYAGYFLAPALFVLVAARPAVIVKRYPYLALTTFLAGSAPLWVYNLLTHENFPTFGVFGSGAMKHSLPENILIYAGKLGYVLGLDFSSAADSLLSAGALAVFGFACISLVLSLARAGRKGFFAKAENSGTTLLLLYMAMVSAANISSSKYAGTSIVRYVLPVYPFVHIALGAGLARLGRKSAVLSAACLFLWLVPQANSSYIKDARAHEPRIPQAYAKYTGMLGELRDFGAQQGARYIATPLKWDAVNLDFDSIALGGPRFVEPLSPMHARDSLDMDLQERQFLLEPSSRAELMRAFLDAQGFTYSSRDFAGSLPDYSPDGKHYFYTMFHNLEKPAFRYRYLPPAKASINVSSGAGLIDRMTDRIINTRWTDRSDGEGQQWIEIDCLLPTPLGRITLDYKTNFRHYPEQIALEVSDNGRNWQRISGFKVIRGLYTVGSRVVERPFSGILNIEVATLEPRRYYRLINPAPRPGSVWSVNELYLYTWQAPEQNPASLADIAALIENKKIRRVYTNSVMAARLIPKVRARCFNEYPWDGRNPEDLHERRMDFSERTAIITDESMAGELCMLLLKNRLEFSRRNLSPYTFVTVEASKRPTGLYWLGFTAAQCFDPALSFALTDMGRREKDRGKAEKLFGRALDFWPDNFAALARLAGIRPSVRYEHTKTIARFMPKNKTDIRIGKLLRVSGYSVKDGGLTVTADFIHAHSAPGRLLVYGLAADGEKVLFSREIKTGDTYPDWNNSHPEGEVFREQRVVFRMPLEDIRQKTQIWIAFLDHEGERLDITRVNGKPYARNRALLTVLEPAAKSGKTGS